ncbi:hypothetical protein [Radicibacter daui]|uniref:hypothetical protein n=1 Tax=Radicibacter daui TaxID=3064829 RepID=UPI004046D990
MDIFLKFIKKIKTSLKIAPSCPSVTLTEWAVSVPKKPFSLFCLALLTACSAPSLSLRTAEKPLTISEQVAQGYRNFRRDPAAGFFTITENGVGYTTTLCTQQGGCPASRLHAALAECQARTQSPCELLGSGKSLRWVYRPSLKPAETAATLCFAALVEDSELLQYMMAIETGMPSSSSSHCAASQAALQSGTADLNANAGGGLTGTSGTYHVTAEEGPWRHITGRLDVLGFTSSVNGWVKSDHGKILLFRSTEAGAVGEEIGPLPALPPV